MLSTESFNSFSPGIEDEIRKVIIKSSDATCFLDPMPTRLIKGQIDILLPTITKIVNESLSSGLFPTDMKKNNLVKPILKKPSLDSEVLNNYRSISNLQFLSILIEPAAVSRITKQVTVNKLYEPPQSAYRAVSSTETTIVKAQNDIHMMIDDKKAVILIRLDLSAVFDTVDHNLLLSWMMTRLGIGGTVLTWLNLYLSGRSQSQHRWCIFTCSYPAIRSPSVVGLRTYPFHYIYTSHWIHCTNPWLKRSFLCRRYSAIHVIWPYWPWRYNINTQVENCISDIRIWMV